MKQNDPRSLPALLLAAALTLSLTACVSRQPAPEDTGSGSDQSQSASGQPDAPEEEAPPEDPVLPPASTPHEVADRFVTALTTGNATALRLLTGAAEGTYESWRDIRFADVSYTVRYEDAQTGHYEFSFTVEESDVPAFPVGSYKRTLVVGQDAFSYGEGPTILQLYNADEFFYEQNPYDQELPGFVAYRAVNNYLSFMPTAEFASPAALSAEEIADYAMTVLAQQSGGERGEFSSEEVEEMACALFAIDAFDGSSTRFYNAESGRYELAGRGGNRLHLQTRPATETADGYTIRVDFFSDPLCTELEKSVLYTLRRQGDSLRLVSGVAL